MIEQSLKEGYGIEVVGLELLSLGADRDAAVYRAEGVGGPYFVKRRKGFYEGAHLEVLSAVEEVVVPLRTREGRLTCSVGGETLIVYPYMKGENGFVRPLSEEGWVKFGEVMRQVHALKAPGVRGEVFARKWAGREIALGGFGEYQEVVDLLLKRVQRLEEKLIGRSFPEVLCHADLHAGNLLIEESGRFHIIDWDDPIRAPKERDLMFIGAGVGNVWNRPEEASLFYRGYGERAVDQLLIAYYRHDRILVDVLEYTEGVLTPEMERDFRVQFEPGGVVEIALEEVLEKF